MGPREKTDVDDEGGIVIVSNVFPDRRRTRREKILEDPIYIGSPRASGSWK